MGKLEPTSVVTFSLYLGLLGRQSSRLMELNTTLGLKPEKLNEEKESPAFAGKTLPLAKEKIQQMDVPELQNGSCFPPTLQVSPKG